MISNENTKRRHVYTFGIILLVTILILATAFPVSAATASFDTDTQIELEPGVIEVTEVPSIYIMGNLTGVQESSVTFYGSIKGKLVIEDARGTFKGWSVHISLEDFLDASGKLTSLGRPTLALDAPQITSESSGTTFAGYNAVMVAGDENYYKVASAPPGTKGGTWNGVFSVASLTVSNQSATQGAFQSKINWSIQDTP